MSRSYNEDWERKKSYLIRSLFHDIPFRALSPVPECSQEVSTQSTDTHIPQESTSSPEIYSESKTTTSSTPPYPAAPPTHVYTALDSRPYSPLPPLIIERMPNRHDDPPEYYQILLNKIRLIYRKMFIEGTYLSDDNFLDSDHEKQSILNDIFEMAGNISDVSEVSCSFTTDGYSADTEMSDCEESNDNLGDSTLNIENYNGIQLAKDVDNLLKSNNAEEYSISNAFDAGYSILANYEEMAEESIVSEGEADYRQITTQADVHIDGAQLAAVSPSPVYEGTPAQITPVLTNEAEELPPDPSDSIYKDQEPETVLVHEINQENAETLANAGPLENIVPLANPGMLEITEPIIEVLPPEPNVGLTYVSAPDSVQMVVGTEVSLVVPTVSEDLVTSPILPHVRREVQACHERLELSEQEDAHNRQTTIQTQMDSSSSLEHRVSKTAQEQAFILRFSKSTEHSFARERESTILEEPPKSSTEDIENYNNNHIEVIRTPRPRSSVASIKIDTTRLTNDVDLTCERDFDPRDNSTVTSASQNGGNGTNSDHRRSSCDIDDVLTSIFNVSLQANIKRATKGSNGRKRVYEEMSAQTESVSWSDLRANFFVGTPKIFRLCTCVDHVCN